MSIALKLYIIESMFVKPKCGREADYTLEKLSHLKHILALSTTAQICTVSVLQSFLDDYFQMEYTV